MPTHDSLNFFDPNPDIPSNHENQLTRAFLVVLRISPAAHQTWLSLASPGRKLYELSRPWSFDTQRWKMFEEVPDIAEPIEGISVLQAADMQEIEGPVQTTDRAQVLDGIVRYGDELLIVIETKLDGPVPTGQAQDLNVHGALVRFDTSVHKVSWRALLAAWSDLVENEIVSGAERTVIADFLDFVDLHFAQLGPLTTLGRCKDHKSRVERRLNGVLSKIAGTPIKDWIPLPERAALDRAYLEFDESSQKIQLAVYPADTLTQAKAFYTSTKAPSQVLALCDGNGKWSAQPNFHFGHMARGMVWIKSNTSPGEYVAYWQAKIGDTRQYPRERWEEFWIELEQHDFATADDKAEFDRSFTNTKRTFATPRPGLKCVYQWNLTEAIQLDDKNKFVKAVAEQMNIILGALDEQLLQMPELKSF